MSNDVNREEGSDKFIIDKSWWFDNFRYNEDKERYTCDCRWFHCESKPRKSPAILACPVADRESYIKRKIKKILCYLLN